MWNEDQDTKHIHIKFFIRMVVTSQQKNPAKQQAKNLCTKSSTYTM